MYTLIIEDKNGVIADEFSFHEGTFSIGRVDGNDIILPSSNVSRQHARLFVRAGKCYVEDLGSSNGIIVDGQRIQGERDLGSAAQIRVGDYYLYLEFNKEAGGNQQDVVSTHIVSQDENAYKLVRIVDKFAGEVFVLSDRRNTIGRTEENAIFLNDASVSRRHAKIDVEGVVYCLEDLGSSNGTCVNGKRISGPTILREGDRVSFGNLDFVFIPTNESVDPQVFAQVAAEASGGRSGLNIGLIVGILAALFIMFLVVVALAFGGYFLYKSSSSQEVEDKPPVAQELGQDGKVAGLVEEGRAKMQKGRYGDAIESFDKALALDPGNQIATREKKKAENERAATEKYDAGLKSKSNAEYEAAKEKLKSISNDTSVYEKAQKEIKEIDNILAGNFKNKGDQAMTSGDIQAARDAYIESMNLKCDEELFLAIKDLEKKMKRNRKTRDIEPYEKPALCK